MLQIQRAVARASAVVLGHSPNEDVQRQVADVLFAKATADGRLSASLGRTLSGRRRRHDYSENTFAFYSGRTWAFFCRPATN